MQKIKEYIHIEENNSLRLFIEAKNEFNSTNLSLKDQLFLGKINNSNKKQEFIQIRALRNKTIGEIEIDYKEDGKPFLVDSKEHISISHSQNFIGILKASFEVGLDIEEINERIFKVKNRFLNEKELKLFDSSIENLTIAWTLKEALFKLNTRSGIDFRKELLIEEKTDYGYNCKILDKDRWRIVKLKNLRKENLIISYNFEPSILL